MEFQFPKLGDELKSIPINIKLININVYWEIEYL